MAAPVVESRRRTSSDQHAGRDDERSADHAPAEQYRLPGNHEAALVKIGAGRRHITQGRIRSRKPHRA